LDVHPPHQPLNSWRDFWIHLGTITVGLLIAIGMEQSVEKLHQIEERHVLQRELREEGLRNQESLRVDFERFALQRNALVTRRRDIAQMIASHGKLKLQYQAIPDIGTITLPSQAAWDSAKASGRVGLLHDAQTEVYSFLYLQEEWLKSQVLAWTASITEKQTFERRFEPDFTATGKDGTPDLSLMSPDELTQYSLILDKEITQRDSLVGFLHYFAVANKVVLDGARTQDEVVHKVDALLK